MVIVILIVLQFCAGATLNLTLPVYLVTHIHDPLSENLTSLHNFKINHIEIHAYYNNAHFITSVNSETTYTYFYTI